MKTLLFPIIPSHWCLRYLNTERSDFLSRSYMAIMIPFENSSSIHGFWQCSRGETANGAKLKEISLFASRTQRGSQFT